jgi:hypothetical protein
MPKPGKQPAPAVVTQIRAIFKKVVKGNKMIADIVEPKVKASKTKPKDRARAATVTRMLKDNKALRTAVRAELRKIGIRPKRKAR